MEVHHWGIGPPRRSDEKTMVLRETPVAADGTRKVIACVGDLVFTHRPLLFLTGVALNAAVAARRHTLPWASADDHCTFLG